MEKEKEDNGKIKKYLREIKSINRAKKKKKEKVSSLFIIYYRQFKFLHVFFLSTFY